MNSILLSCVLVLFASAVTLAAPTGGKLPWQKKLEEKLEQINYLRKYGHWAGPKDSEAEEDFINALKNFQRHAQLPETGVVDEETLDMMQRPRCGLVDHPDHADRQKRYINYDIKWGYTDLTYNYLNYSSDLTVNETREAIEQALKFWSDASALTFKEVPDSGTLKMLFARGEHGDGVAFDGPGNVLAHGFYPLNGGMHFDEDEGWTVNSTKGTNLLQVATHEIGHTLGIAHSNQPDAIMWPYYHAYDPNMKLTDDDIQAIQALYGPPKKSDQ